MAESLYHILRITENADAAEVRKAYISMIRVYPNETFPEEFKRIKKAYEILSDPSYRREYDTMEKYGEEIKLLEEESARALDSNDIDKALSIFKKILMIEPNLHRVRNQFALALSRNREYDRALKQFLKLIEIEPENAVYRTNLAFACEYSGLVDEAVVHFKEAHLLDPKDVEIVYALAGVYIRREQFDKAKKVIEEAILEKGNEGFHKFYYLIKILEINIIERSVYGIERSFTRIEKLLERYPEEKSYVAMEYGKLAYDLNEEMMFDWAKKLTERAIQLDPTNKKIEMLHGYTSGNEAIIDEYNLLEKDDKIMQPLKHSAALYIFGGSVEESEFKESSVLMFNNFQFIARNHPVETISSIKRMLIKYPAIFDARKDLLTELLEQAKTSKEEHKQYDQMKNDSAITHSLKRLIALYLSDLEQEERKHYFEDILDEMNDESPGEVKRGIDYLRKKYSALYDLNPEFLTELRKKL